MFDNKQIAKRDELNNKVMVDGKLVTVDSGSSASLCQLIFGVITFNLWWILHLAELANPGL